MCLNIIYFIVLLLLLLILIIIIVTLLIKKYNRITPIHKHKTLTLVFADISDSTILWENCSHIMQDAITNYYSILDKFSKKYDGDIINTEGDNMFIAFENIINAVCWCIDIDSELLTTEWPTELLKYEGAKHITNEFGNTIYNGITIHVGLHIGIPICKYNSTIKHNDYYGPVVNKAARIQSIAKKGQIILSSLSTYTLIDALIEYNPSSIIHNDVDYFEFVLNKKKVEIKYNGIYNLKGIEMPERLYILIHQTCSDRHKYDISRIGSDTLDNSVLSQKGSKKCNTYSDLSISCKKTKNQELKLYNLYKDDDEFTEASSPTKSNSNITKIKSQYEISEMV